MAVDGCTGHGRGGEGRSNPSPLSVPGARRGRTSASLEAGARVIWGVVTIAGYGRQQLRLQHGRIAATYEYLWLTIDDQPLVTQGTHGMLSRP